MNYPPIIAANWKMHKTIGETQVFMQSLIQASLPKGLRILISPPFTAISAAHQIVSNSPIEIGAQTMHHKPQGAFTGEISSGMLREAGASFVILGHSERRQFFGATNQSVNLAIKQALSDGLDVILCIGESDVLQSSEREAILRSQIFECLQDVPDLQRIILAYEPVWAIGTGKTATPPFAEEVHAFCRNLIQKRWNQNLPILYGGSVKPENFAELLAQKNIDGALIGGASLELNSFINILQTAGSIL